MPSNDPRMQPSSTLSESPSTLNGPPGLLIGERNSSARTSTITRYNSSHQVSSNTRDSRSSSSISGIPSTLNGPPDLLVGEWNRSHITSSANQPANVFLVQQGDKQKSRVDKNSNQPARSQVAEEPSTLLNQGSQQSKIFSKNDEFLPIKGRRIVINDRLAHEKDSVFKRLGPKVNTRSYSEVVEQKNENVQPMVGQKRINPGVPSPRKRINSNQAAIINTNGSII